MSYANMLYFAESGVDPINCTLYMCIIMLPEACGFLFGIMSEQVTIFGSKRRGHLLLASFL